MTSRAMSAQALYLVVRAPEMRSQSSDTSLKVAGKSCLFPDAIKKIISKRQCADPSICVDARTQIGRCQRIRQTTSGTRRKTHRQDVVGRRQFIRAAMLAGKGQIAVMHVGIADQRPKRIQQ